MNAPVSLANSKQRRRNLAKLWLNVRMPLVAVVVLGTVLGGGKYFWSMYQGAAVDTLETQYVAIQESFYTSIRSPVPGYIETADASVASNDIATVLDGGDESAMEAAEKAVSDAVPGALGARLIHLNRRRPEESRSPPISFATLDLIHGSKTSGEQPPVELHLSENEQEHLAVIRRVLRPDGELAGHVLVAFSMDEIKETFNSAPFSLGYAELAQRISGRKPLRISGRGDEDLRSGVARQSKRLDGSLLRIQIYFPPSEDADLAVIGELVPVIGGVVLLAIFGALGALVAARQRKRAKGKVMYGGAVSAVVVDDEGPEGAFADATAPKEAPKPRAVESVSFAGADALADAGESASAGPPSFDTDLEKAEASPAANGGPEDANAGGIADSIFRAYDIRGVVGETLDVDVVRRLGKAIGTEAFERGQQTLIVARDGRLSSDELRDALVEGLTSSGRDVIDVGRVPTPVLYFSTYFLNTGSGVMLTGSHNPSQYNGLKIMLAGDILFDDAIQDLKRRVRTGDVRDGQGQIQTMDLLADYVRRVTEDMPVALGNAMKIVVDCGNGVASDVAPKLIRALGHDVIELFCEVDGNFPNHHPDPSDPVNMQALIASVAESGADLGLAFDGDGDRIGVVDDTGEIIWPDRLMMVYARDILSRHPGTPVVYDVKCTSRLRQVIEASGGEPVMDKTGHSYMRNKLHETGAELAGELSGHIFFKERWFGFDDAMYAGARLLEILMLSGKRPSELFAEVPTGVTTPELRLDMAEGAHFELMTRLEAQANFTDAQVFTIDGLRVEFADGWGLVRASNTTPSLVLRFEADDEAALARIQDEFRSLIDSVEPGLTLPY
jgi:phosphomannomutase / phosphoglucomutase